MLIPKIVLLAAIAALSFGQNTPLDRYVAAPDSHYKYELLKTVTGKGYTSYIIDLTSQQWRSASEVDRPIWKHWLTIVRPDDVKGETGMLYINGGSVTQKAPAGASPDY